MHQFHCGPSSCHDTSEHPGLGATCSRDSLPIDDNGLAIDDAGPRRQSRHRGGDFREAAREIVAVSRKQLYAIALTPSENAEAVVLDLVNSKVRPGGVRYN